MNVLNIILYIRKSRKDYEFIHEDIEKTLERHEKILQEFALKTYGKKIPEENIFREVASGDTIADRPKMQEVLSLIEDNKYKAVLVLEIERLARGNTIDQGIIAQTFEYTDTLIITPQKIFNLHDDLDRSFFEDGLFQSRKYLLYTKKILARGREQSSKEGKFVGSITPFGYNKMKLKNEKGYKLIINESEAQIVKLIFSLYLNDVGTQMIANKLNQMKVKPRKNDIWTPNMIRNILQSEAVCGRIVWNKRKTVSVMENGKLKKTNPVSKNYVSVKGLHEAIIDEETWEKTKKIMLSHKTKKASSEIKDPLAGLVYCELCGKKMVRRPYKNGYNDSLICRNNLCNNVSSDLVLVENRVVEELKKTLKNYKNSFIDNLEKEVIDYDLLINNVNKDISSIENKLDKIYDLFENGIYDKIEFEKRRNKLKNDIVEKQCSIVRLQHEKEINSKESYEKMIPKIEYILSVYYDIDNKLRNRLLKSIIEKITYKKTRKGRWDKSAINDFSVKIEMKL